MTSRHSQNWMMACVMIPMLACCLAGMALVIGSQVAAASVEQANGFLTPMCLWARNGQVGLWWNTSISPARAFSNAHRYNAVCVALPWTASMPQRGLPRLDLP